MGKMTDALRKAKLLREKKESGESEPEGPAGRKPDAAGAAQETRGPETAPPAAEEKPSRPVSPPLAKEPEPPIAASPDVAESPRAAAPPPAGEAEPRTAAPPAAERTSVLPWVEPGDEAVAAEEAKVPSHDERRTFLASWLDKDGEAAELFRGIRNVIQKELPAARVIIVTSCEPGAGKTTLAVNLAAAFAASIDEKVLLIDANHAAPRLGEVLEAGDEGLVQVASGQIPPEAAAVKTDIPGLWAVPLGRKGERSEGLLESKAVAALLKAAKSRFTRVIVESPSFNDPDDIPSSLDGADAAIVCVRERVTRRKDLGRLLAKLKAAHVRQIRCVFMSF